VTQRRFDGACSGRDTELVVGDQDHVLGWAGDHAVGQERVAASQREPVPGRGGQCHAGDAAVQRADRHQATGVAAASSTGWCSSRAWRTPGGRNSSGHTRVSVSACS
jgi:hypothetical protein